jgi:shikimate dehydrogenase
MLSLSLTIFRPLTSMPPEIPVFDMVYSPGETSFVIAASEYGHPAVGGLGMLAGQGEQSFRLWTGAVPPEGVLRSCLLARQQGRLAA